MKMPLKIMMCCHKHFSIVPPYCIPVQGGAKINPPISGAVPDYGEGGGISEKNCEYCELTVQYFAWKNVEAQSYGFCHYRRFFVFNDHLPKHLAKKTIDSKEHMKYFGTTQSMIDLIRDYDVIITSPEDMGISVKQYYATSQNHFKEDLTMFTEILYKMYPYIATSSEKYLSQNKQYFCNMFIMSKELFFEYCGLLFPVLDEFDKVKNKHNSYQADRVDGYLGERFLGIYITFLKEKNVKIKEVSRIDTECSIKKRLELLLFPPESKRRITIRKIICKMKVRCKE